ncbi:hypothetical protein COB72_10675 [bacterium]|nr:MAG: hypothetical protein COB72_10675 [bacterium]
MHIRSPLIIAATLSLLTTSAQAIVAEPDCPSATQISISDPLHHAEWFAIEGDYAYILDESEDYFTQLVIINISDPNNLITVSATEFPFANSFYIQIYQNAAYIFHYSKMFTIDISDPTSPTFTHEYTLSSEGYPLSAPIHNGYMYIYDFDILDLADPLHPQFAANIQTQKPIVHFANGFGYTTNAQALDMTDPLNPLATSNGFGSTSARQFIQDQNTLIGLSSSGFSVDITNPSQPIMIDSNINLDVSFYRGDAITSSILYEINDDRSGIIAFDLSNPSNAMEIQRTEFNLPASIREIEIHDDYMLALSTQALYAYRISTKPVAATHQTLGSANDLIIKDNTLITANDTGSLQFFDITNHTRPQLISTLILPDDAVAIDYKDNTAYIATTNDNLNLIDITDPSNPTLISNIDTGRRASDVQVVGDLLYAVDRIFGLSIFDISDATNPQHISTLNTPGWANDITIDDENKIAYIAHSQYDLQIVDIADIASPTIIATITPLSASAPNGINTSTRVGNLLYTPEGNFGYRIFDITDPTNPTQLAHFDAIAQSQEGQVTGFAHQITIKDNTLYLANGTGGFLIYDNTDPFNPTQAQWIKTRESTQSTNSIRRILLRDNIAFAAVYEGGLRIYDLSVCSPCPADLNGDALLNFFDISLFLQAFQAQDPIADFDNDGLLNFFDIAAYLIEFAAGCP